MWLEQFHLAPPRHAPDRPPSEGGTGTPRASRTRADGATRAARRRLDPDARVRSSCREPGVRPAQPTRARTRRNRRPCGRRRAPTGARRRPADLPRPRRRAGRRIGGARRRPLRNGCTRATSSRISSFAGRAARRPSSEACGPIGSGRSIATASEADASGNHTEGDAWALVAPGTARHVTPARPPRLEDIAATAAALAADLGDLAGTPLLEPA